MTSEASGVALDARIVPVPTSISEAAQDVLRRLVGEDGKPVNARHVMPDPADRAAWTALKASVDAHYDQAALAMAAGVRATTETIEIGTARVHVATPEFPTHPGRAFIDLHGGALISGGGEACKVAARRQADLHGATAYGIDYRMPPEHPYPAGLDDCLAVYRHILGLHAPRDIVLAGRSAGGNLAAAMLLRARDEGLPMPAALILLSPQVDLTESGDSFAANRLLDLVLPLSLMNNHLLYAAGADLAHPYLSPLFGDLTGFPPTFLQSGTRDLFLSNTVRMHRRLRAAGVPAGLHVFEAMPHGGFLGAAPEDQELIDEIARFVRAHWNAARGD